MEQKIVNSGQFEDVLEINDHYYIISKKDRIGVIPYTISTNGIIDKIGIVNDFNILKRKTEYTILYDYVNTDDISDLNGANRILKMYTNVNIKDASKWMYLGNLFYSIATDSPIKLYCVDISNIDFNNIKINNKKDFQLIDVENIIASEDAILIAGYTRIFNMFYVQTINQ